MPTDDPQARRITLAGHVQGVGFRPFVYRLAVELGLRGWVKNVTGRVEIHAEGDSANLDAFARGLIAQAPPLALPRLLGNEVAKPSGLDDFRILESSASAEADIHLPTDNFVCPQCLAEMQDPGNRRYRYAFTNCTQCGPRYTLIRALPYDRANTAMAGFPLCPACRAEYEDPMDRRFHAEPIACPVCGPHLEYVEAGSAPTGDDEAALAAAVAALKAGRIVAVKGIGGYHLMCDARREAAVQALRARKPRPAKPLAVMFPDLDSLARQVSLPPGAASLIASPARPIVLLPKGKTSDLAPGIAPGLAEIGCLLAYSPLHHLLLRDLGGPLVATSGNISGEPVLTDNAEATVRLARIADAFLHHDRPIVRPADDAVYRPIVQCPRPVRLGRGTAPLELELPRPLAEPVLALGSHMKNTLCLAWNDRAVLSPHVGELDSERSLATLAQVAEDLQRIYQVRARRLLLDRHPGYGYRRWARDSGLPLREIWHHHAHASALAWEFPGVTDWIVFAWDGVGLGEDGGLWGGEAFVGGPGRWQRRASLRPFRLPGADSTGRAPWRSAAALLWETGEAAPFAPELLFQAWQRGINAPASSAAGRLFDAAAALTGVCSQASFEGEGPMRLEAIAESSSSPWRRGSSLIGLGSRLRGSDVPPLPLSRDESGLWRSDWAPLVAMLGDTTLTQAERAYRFHASLALALVDQAERLREEAGCHEVGLTGGVFQNRLLTELALAMLEQAGFRVHLPARVPVNDAGVSFGQVLEFLALQQ
jgi:hydrogenase maturation protein HypF